jgi:hypothetical protein
VGRNIAYPFAGIFNANRHVPDNIRHSKLTCTVA